MSDWDLSEFKKGLTNPASPVRKSVRSLHYDTDSSMGQLILKMRGEGINPTKAIELIVLRHFEVIELPKEETPSAS